MGTSYLNTISNMSPEELKLELVSLRRMRGTSPKYREEISSKVSFILDRLL